MRVTVHFSKLLQPLTDTESFTVTGTSYFDIVSAVKQLFIKLSSLKTPLLLVDGDLIIHNDKLPFSPKSSDIFIVPAITGNQDLISGLSAFYGTTTALSSEELALTGLNKRILDSSLFGKAQTAFDISQRASDRASGISENTDDPTTGFGSLTITSVSGQKVPLHFGMVRTGGAVINQYIKHIQRGGVDSVKVSDYI